MNSMTLGDLASECGVNMEIINKFLQTFDFYSHQWTHRNPKTNYIAKDNIISEEMIQFLRNNKKLIQKFKADYIEPKTVYTISKRIGVNSTTILNYLNNYSYYYRKEFNTDEGKGLEQLETLKGPEVQNSGNKITLSTRIYYLSSYQILKEIQLYERRKLIQEAVEFSSDILNGKY